MEGAFALIAMKVLAWIGRVAHGLVLKIARHESRVRHAAKYFGPRKARAQVAFMDEVRYAPDEPSPWR